MRTSNRSTEWWSKAEKYMREVCEGLVHDQDTALYKFLVARDYLDHGHELQYPSLESLIDAIRAQHERMIIRVNAIKQLMQGVVEELEEAARQEEKEEGNGEEG